MKKLLIIIAIVALLSSCSNYYKTITTSGGPTGAAMEELKKQKKVFIVRDNAQAYMMNNVTTSADGKNIEADLSSIPDQHTTHMWRAPGEKLKYDKTYADFVLNEVHLYTVPDSNMAPGHYTLPIRNVQKTEVLQKDVAKTRRNHIMAAVWTVVGTAAVIAAVGAAMAGAFFLSF